MDIHPSARKHGIADDDIEHAVRNAMTIYQRPGDRILHLGPAGDGTLLAVVTALRVGAQEIAIHAMRMRPKYQHLLPGEAGS